MNYGKLLCYIYHDYEHQETLENGTGIFKCSRCGKIKSKYSRIPTIEQVKGVKEIQNQNH